MTAKDGIQVFLSYSATDRAWVDQLTAYLTALKWRGEIQYWHDRQIEAGMEWEKAIASYLDSADIILILLSPDFLASEYSRIEAERALKRNESGQAVVIPVLLRPVDFSATPFAQLQTAPDDAIPITRWEDRDKALLNVTRVIRRAAKKLTIQAAANEA